MRELKEGKAFVKSLPVSGDAIDWLRQQAKAGDVLLAHQDDGVVWGKAHKDGDWRAREIADEVGEGKPAFVEWYDEPQLLWGDHGKHEVVNDVTFAVLEEGAQGLRHAPPIALPFDADGSLGSRNRACLLVRHYLAREDVARVVASRLVGLATGKKEQ